MRATVAILLLCWGCADADDSTADAALGDTGAFDHDATIGPDGGAPDGAASDDAAAPDRALPDGSSPPPDAAPTRPDGGVAPDAGAAIYQPPPGTTWQWQLTGRVNASYDVELYDIDLFDTDPATIDDLRADGRRVICYFSAGSWEDWREDADAFPPAAIGNPLEGWPGERWLDFRDAQVRRLMEARMDLARQKRCDGVEPDNVDGHDNNPGFALTPADQLDYNRFLADAAHARGLAVALKNATGLIPQLEPHFDFAVNEECFEYGECDTESPFINAGKAVLQVEYADDAGGARQVAERICADARQRRFSSLVLPWDLDDSFRVDCSE